MHHHFVDAPQVQPLRSEVADQGGGGARIGQHPPHLLLEHGGLRQLAAFGGVQQRGVGNAAPQEERQSRGELDVAEPATRRDRDARGAGNPDRPACARARTGCRHRTCRRPCVRPRRIRSGFVDRRASRRGDRPGAPSATGCDSRTRSSSADVGSQTKIRRRLAVSAMVRATRCGPPISTAPTAAYPM